MNFTKAKKMLKFKSSLVNKPTKSIGMPTVPTVLQTPLRMPLTEKLQQALMGLLGLAGTLVISYVFWLLSPHIREAIYGYFGHPPTTLDKIRS